MKTGVQQIADERKRQIEKENRSLEFDIKSNANMELTQGAIYYAKAAKLSEEGKQKCEIPSDQILNLKYLKEIQWPENWDSDFAKAHPFDTIRNLVKAGALIAAEIDRLQTAEELK